MENRLKVNMQNKIEIINGAIKQCNILKQGGTIKLDGINKINVTRGKITDDDFDERIKQLMLEKINLQERVNRFK